jgi:hypothetical protein
MDSSLPTHKVIDKKYWFYNSELVYEEWKINTILLYNEVLKMLTGVTIHLST